MIKTILNNVLWFVAVIVMLDILILFTAMAQVAVEGRTGYWNGFWLWQARQVVKILHE